MDPRQNLLPRYFVMTLVGVTLGACSTTAERSTDTAAVSATTTVAPVDRTSPPERWW